MNLIVPIAGKSSRYPNVKPKWMLAHPNGKFMAIQAISGLDLSKFNNIVFVYLRQHEELYHFKEGFINELESLNIKNYILCELEHQTKDVTETVVQAITSLKLKGPIFIKDSDSYFTCSPTVSGNFICYTNLKNSNTTNPAGSSYITLDENNVITNIVEKQIISSNICVGGYVFDDCNRFLDIANKLNSNTERYVSDIVYFDMLYNQTIFRGIEINDLEDWGTLTDWINYKKKFATIFLDIDGVLVKHSSIHFPPYIGMSEGIDKNIEYITSLDLNKIEIILTTSRSEMYRDITEKQLQHLGIKYKQLIMGLQSNKRIIVNDYSSTNVYPNCIAVNLKRNSDELENILKSSL
jgi:hypothetical protein